MSRGVVVTGIGIWSPFGRGTELFWDGLVRGASGRKPVTRFRTEHPAYRTREAATIAQIRPEATGEAEIDASRLLAGVVEDLLAMATIEPDDVSPYDVAVCLGSSQSATKLFSDYLRQKRGAEIAPAAFQNRLWISSGALLSEVARQVGALGPSLIVSTACASGTSSIGLGYELIGEGRIKRAFAGGVGFFSEISFSGFNILRLTAPNGCRPFDAQRDGMMFGDGFALVTLEDEDLARERGAKVLARVVGYASGNEAHHATSPAPDGQVGFRVMWEALNRDPGLLSRLDYINAHGTGTTVNDIAELLAIRRLVRMREGAGTVAISSTKGQHGHALGAAGSVEFVATVLAIQHGVAPPTCGLENPEPGFEDLDLIRGVGRPHPIRVALSNSFAFGGNAAAIALAAPYLD